MDKYCNPYTGKSPDIEVVIWRSRATDELFCAEEKRPDDLIGWYQRWY
jgi:hypothetical protein